MLRLLLVTALALVLSVALLLVLAGCDDGYWSACTKEDPCLARYQWTAVDGGLTFGDAGDVLDLEDAGEDGAP